MIDFVEWRRAAAERVAAAQAVAATALVPHHRVEAVVWEMPADAATFEPMMSLRRPAIAGIAAILIGFGGFLVWAFTANLDSASVASGTVIADSRKKTVSHLEDGILSALLVAEGDTVKAGQPLLKLDDTRARSDLAGAAGTRIGLLARLARLRAEQAEAPAITFPNELLADHSDMAQSVMSDETHVFANRRDIYQGNLAVQQKQVEQFQTESEAYAAQLTAATEQETILKQQLVSIQDLADKGVVPKRQATDLAAQLSQVSGNVGLYTAQRSRSGQEKAAAELALLSLRMTWQGDIANDIQDTQLKLNAATQLMKVAADTLDRLTIRAPEDGTVLNVQVRTQGSAISAGQPLLDIEPGDEPLIVEARLSPLDIDSVKVGEPAEVRLTAYDPRTYPVLDGKLLYVAADQTEDRERGLIYYTVRAEIDAAALAAHPEMRLHPGMPADVVIKRASRKAIDYILSPITATFYRAFREE
ncbi:MAG TPA: HlyD family type I secretion periplasmic adaptor subunit [Pseudolabrys sp.]|nr:HlyD family type I secretion periplasmic adaptor subunit [Pseudolabrys sp.]HVY19764.1 HlyD family type I secretion periplasmic adaptor subunit [Bauldia sp.]